MRRELLRILSRVLTDPFGDDIIDFPAAMQWYIAAALERPEEAEGWLRDEADRLLALRPSPPWVRRRCSSSPPTASGRRPSVPRGSRASLDNVS